VALTNKITVRFEKFARLQNLLLLSQLSQQISKTKTETDLEEHRALNIIISFNILNSLKRSLQVLKEDDVSLMITTTIGKYF
jgi:hypothetical protein